jgi:hypothetical protein
VYLLYIFLPELHTLMASLFNFFNPSKKNSFSCAANRKEEKPKTYQHPYVGTTIAATSRPGQMSYKSGSYFLKGGGIVVVSPV